MLFCSRAWSIKIDVILTINYTSTPNQVMRSTPRPIQWKPISNVKTTLFGCEVLVFTLWNRKRICCLCLTLPFLLSNGHLNISRLCVCEYAMGRSVGVVLELWRENESKTSPQVNISATLGKWTNCSVCTWAHVPRFLLSPYFLFSILAPSSLPHFVIGELLIACKM